MSENEGKMFKTTFQNLQSSTYKSTSLLTYFQVLQEQHMWGFQNQIQDYCFKYQNTPWTAIHIL